MDNIGRTIQSLLSNLTKTDEDGTQCTESDDCEDEKFCNFDNGKSGACETCHDFLNPETDCAESGFTNEKGEEECKSICQDRK